jgi:hypothetical protein
MGTIHKTKKLRTPHPEPHNVHVLLTIFSALQLFIASSLMGSPVDSVHPKTLHFRFALSAVSIQLSVLCLSEMVFQQARVDVPGQRLIAVTAIAVDGDPRSIPCQSRKNVFS